MATQTMASSAPAPPRTAYTAPEPSCSPARRTRDPFQTRATTQPTTGPVPSAPSFPGPSSTQAGLPRPQAQSAPPSFIEQMPGPAFDTGPPPLAATAATASRPDLRSAKSSAEFGLREYMSLQRRRYQQDELGAGIEERLRLQAETVGADLDALRKGVAEVVSAAESRRWRRWLAGGVLAAFIPAVRAVFRRPGEETDASNDTEYAFQKSKTLIGRILASPSRRGGLATVAFLVFAVLYVFQNEVSLRVARTVVKRLKKLGSKVDRGEEDITEQDMKLLRGWRWRVLLWAS